MNEEYNQNGSVENSVNEEPQAAPTYGGTAYGAGSAPVKQKKKRGGAAKMIALALVCALLGSLGGAAAAVSICNARDEARDSTTVYVSEKPHSDVTTAVVTTPGTEMTDAEIYAANAESTVGIQTQVTTTNFFGMTTTGAASGSGFVLTADGYIVTNQHVIEDASSITVVTYDNTEHPATLVGFDERNDIAVLKIDAENLKPVTIGSSDAVKVGEHVVAIGNPLGELTFSLTQGAVSAKDRTVTVSTGVTMDLLQTDCAINSGNSGGPLFNSCGEVIGITNAKYSSSSSGASVDNIGFAIPIDSVMDIITQIVEKGVIVKPYIGVSVMTVSSEARNYGIPAGASIQMVEEGGPAATAGLQVNDIVTAANGEAVSSSNDLSKYIGKCEPGDTLSLTVYRNGETVTVDVVIGSKTQDALQSNTTTTTTTQSQQGQQSGGFGGWPFG